MTQADKETTLIKSVDHIELSSKAISDLFDVTPEMIRQLVSKGMPKLGRGRFSLVECNHWILHRLKQKADADENSDIHEEKLKLVKAQRQRVELDNKKVRGELLDAETVGTVYNQAAATFASQLDGLGARVASILAGIEDPGEIQRVIFDECRAIRESTSAELIDSAYQDDGRGDHQAAESKKRRAVGRRKSNTAKRVTRTRAVANG